jgi:hypothetical protein
MGFGTTKAAMAQNPGRAVADIDVCVALAGCTIWAHWACPSDNFLKAIAQCWVLLGSGESKQGFGFWLLHAACLQTHLASWQDMRVRIVIVHLCR